MDDGSSFVQAKFQCKSSFTSFKFEVQNQCSSSSLGVLSICGDSCGMQFIQVQFEVQVWFQFQFRCVFPLFGDSSLFKSSLKSSLKHKQCSSSGLGVYLLILWELKCECSARSRDLNEAQGPCLGVYFLLFIFNCGMQCYSSQVQSEVQALFQFRCVTFSSFGDSSVVCSMQCYSSLVLLFDSS